MKGQVLVQKLKKVYERRIDIAVKYYSILSLLNNMELTDREIQLLAHTAVKGTISTIASKNEFTKLFPGSTIATINNLISTLKKRHLLVKDERMVRVNPAINLNFNKANNFVFNISCILQNESTT